MTDRELLELAAKAAGRWKKYVKGPIENRQEYWGYDFDWNPLTDDGDALRLAVKLGINVWKDEDIIWIGRSQQYRLEPTDDPYAFVRRAIVRAAAEIGRNMK